MGADQPPRRLQEGRRRLTAGVPSPRSGRDSSPPSIWAEPDPDPGTHDARQLVVRVLPDVTGLDKTFDYVVPARWREQVDVGTQVRAPLHGRRVGGWVVEMDPPDAVADGRLKELTKVSSLGPSAELIELARWASVRWAAGRLRPFLQAASPPTNVARRPPVDRRRPDPARVRPEVAARLEGDGGVLRWPPNDELRSVVSTAATLGPALIVVPAVESARRLAASLRRDGWSVALVPDEWARAAGGVDIVVGTRLAAWAPCPDLAVAVVLDEHDEALQEERSPTWHARDVAIERARRAGVPVLIVSPCPTTVAQGALGPAHRRAAGDERASWPIVQLVDRTQEEPWKTSLVTSALITHLRDAQRTVVCVHNTPGRARVLACRSCRSLVRCATCDAAVALDDDGRLGCRRCGTVRPPVCLVCGAGAFANLRPGVTRIREELEAAAGRPVVAVTGADRDDPAPAGVYVGTEAVLHRVPRADVVAFLDIDAELLAPRYRAAEQAMALLVRAARVVGPRARDGRLLVQTFLPDHEVVKAAIRADPGRLTEAERARRQLLGLPPFAALAAVSGTGADTYVDELRQQPGVVVGGQDPWLVRADDWFTLGEALLATPRPKAARLRIAVDPPRA